MVLEGFILEELSTSSMRFHSGGTQKLMVQTVKNRIHLPGAFTAFEQTGQSFVIMELLPVFTFGGTHQISAEKF